MATKETEPCCSNHYFSVDDPLRKTFLVIKPAKSMADLESKRKPGVYCLRQGDSWLFRIIGPCPNWNQGSCDAGVNCIKALRSE